MSIPRRPYSYIPDELFNCGDAGEHPATFLAWIDDREPGKEPSVSILKVYITPIFPSESDEWDITSAIKGSPSKRSEYEEKIRQDYLKNKNRDYEEDVGA